MNRKKNNKNKNKKILNIIINIICLISVILIILAIFNINNIKSFIKDKNLKKQCSIIYNDQNNIKILEHNKNMSSYELFLNIKNKELNEVIKNTTKNNHINNIIINKIKLKKINNINSNDTIKLDIPNELKSHLFASYVQSNIKENKIYFTFIDNSTYVNESNLLFPNELILMNLEKAGYTEILDLTNSNKNYKFLYSELRNNIAVINKINNEYVKIDYLDPYISENNNYSANMISQLLIEYQKNYNNSINTKDYKNTVFNTRNSNSKYVTIITDTNNIDILNIKPSGKLYNIMFETEIPILNEKYKIN